MLGLSIDPIGHETRPNDRSQTQAKERLCRGEEHMTEGYYCIVCGRFLLANEFGVIVHDDISHPHEMAFDDEENPQ